MAARLDTIETSIRSQLHGVQRIETGHWDEVPIGLTSLQPLIWLSF